MTVSPHPRHVGGHVPAAGPTDMPTGTPHLTRVLQAHMLFNGQCSNLVGVLILFGLVRSHFLNDCVSHIFMGKFI